MTTTLLDAPAVRASQTPATRLRTTTAAVRVSMKWLGIAVGRLSSRRDGGQEDGPARHPARAELTTFEPG